MSEDDLLGGLLKRFSREPDKGSMNEYERKADGMAEDLRSVLNRVLPNDQNVQWAVRTSMEEKENFGALDSLMSELDPDQLRKLQQRTGKSESELRKFYRVDSEGAGREPAQSADVIVECNIDHEKLREPFRTAEKFIYTVAGRIQRHKPDQKEVFVDELTPLSQGQRPSGSGAEFFAKYTFKER